MLKLPDDYKEFKYTGSEKMVLFTMWPGVADSGTDIWETSSGLDLPCSLVWVQRVGRDVSLKCSVTFQHDYVYN